MTRSSADIASAGGSLRRVLGVGFGLAVIVGNAIGAGILRAPGDVAARLPDPTLFILAWAAGAVYAWLGALQLAELGALLPRAGGQYVFARRALGEYAGFIVGWSDWLSTCGTTAAVSIVIAEFADALAPAWGIHVPAAAIAVSAAFAALQWRGIAYGSRAQTATSAMKAAAFAVLVLAAWTWTGSAPTAAGAPAVPEGLSLALAFVAALPSVIYTYDGWSAAVYFSEEFRDPGRDLPRALVGGVLAVAATYVLVCVSLLHVLPMQALAGDVFAIGVLAETVWGHAGRPIFLALAIVSLLSAVNSNQLLASRVLFAMSRDGVLWRGASTVNAGGTPTRALLLSAAAAALFIAFGQTFRTVITVLAFFFVANYTLSFASLFVLRRREPRQRPYAAWGYPWTTGLALAGSVAFLAGAIAADTRSSLHALLLLAGSYPLFRLHSRRTVRRRRRGAADPDPS